MSGLVAHSTYASMPQTLTCAAQPIPVQQIRFIVMHASTPHQILFAAKYIIQRCCILVAEVTGCVTASSVAEALEKLQHSGLEARMRFLVGVFDERHTGRIDRQMLFNILKACDSHTCIHTNEYNSSEFYCKSHQFLHIEQSFRLFMSSLINGSKYTIFAGGNPQEKKLHGLHDTPTKKPDVQLDSNIRVPNPSTCTVVQVSFGGLKIRVSEEQLHEAGDSMMAVALARQMDITIVQARDRMELGGRDKKFGYSTSGG